MDNHVKQWAFENVEPKNFDVLLINQKDEIRRKSERKEALNPIREDIHQIIEEQTKKIC